MTAIEAATNVSSRLEQMKLHWEAAAKNYFDPAKFQLALQSTITTSRTVSFILQSNKSNFPDFDTWYAGYQERWRSDPVMKWAVQARNTIEKVGDLKTYSQVKSSIIASYVGGPTTNWVSQDLFKSPLEMLLALPPKYFRVPQIFEHGTLVIERRWVDSELPDREVLDALAHIYAEFVALVTDLFSRVGAVIPSAVADAHPISMQPLIMDRAIYISVKDGKEVGIRLSRKPLSVDEEKQVERRYGKSVNWDRLKNVKSLKELTEVYFANAQKIMLKDGHHRAFLMLFRDFKMLQVLGMDHPDRATRYVITREMAAYAKRAGADTVILIAEAWTALREHLPPSGYAVDAPKRGEALTLISGDKSGNTFSCSATVVRKLIKKHKIKGFKDIACEENADQFILVPFQLEWGCITEDELEKRALRLEEMGFEASFDEVVDD